MNNYELPPLPGQAEMESASSVKRRGNHELPPLDEAATDTAPVADANIDLEGATDDTFIEEYLAALENSEAKVSEIAAKRSGEIYRAKLDEMACQVIATLMSGLKDSVKRNQYCEDEYQYSLLLKPRLLDLDSIEWQRWGEALEDVDYLDDVGVLDLEDVYMHHHKDILPDEVDQLVNFTKSTVESAINLYATLIPPEVSIESTKINAELLRDNPKKSDSPDQPLYDFPRDSHIILKITASIG